MKLSTSKDALVFADAAFSADTFSSSLLRSCGSIEANVLENGFAGTPLGDTADCGAVFPRAGAENMSDGRTSDRGHALGAFSSPAAMSVCAVFAVDMFGGNLAS